MPEPDRVFGKLPKRSDSRTLQLPLIYPDLFAGKVTPKPVYEMTVKRSWEMFRNDKLRDCACAAAGHAEALWAALYHRRPPYTSDPTEDQIVDAYSKITGYKEGDETTDEGADLLSVLKYWQSTGIADQKITAFAEIPPRDINTLKWSIASFGVAYVGLLLPSAWEVKRDYKIFAKRGPWYDPANWRNPSNGHCVIYTGYSQNDEFTCVTWDKVMKVSRAFHLACCDEAYAIIPPELVNDIAKTPGPEALNAATDPLEALNTALGKLKTLNTALTAAKAADSC